jgi:nucleotidyltransferase/DNA polymerase involved in DNA repair
MQRKIIHIDMDAFYASIEQREDPTLAGRPVAVGGRVRGVVMAASYEARAYGVRSAMPSTVALRRCPELVFVKPHFEIYRAVSRQVREIFHRYTDLVEPVSIDEAYLDVTVARLGPPSATLIAARIRKEIHESTGLTASAGVSYNRFLAKTASGMNKPDGLTVVLPEEVSADRERKSLGAERTFDRDLGDVEDLEERLTTIAADVMRRLGNASTTGRTVTLKIKYHDFTISTRSRTLPHDLRDEQELLATGLELLNTPAPPAGAVRLLGLTVSNLRLPESEKRCAQLMLEF